MDRVAEPLTDGEILFRRVSVASTWYQLGILSAEAFRPFKHDKTGLSVFRGLFRSAESAAKGPNPNGYNVAQLNVGEVRAEANVSVVTAPDTESGWDESHAEIPEINYESRKSARVLEAKQKLAEIAMRNGILGPFHEQHE